MVRLAWPSGVVEAPVRVTGDVQAGVAALAFGQGHAALGRHAKGRGANAFRLQGADAATLEKTGGHEDVISVLYTQSQFDRETL